MGLEGLLGEDSKIWMVRGTPIQTFAANRSPLLVTLLILSSFFSHSILLVITLSSPSILFSICRCFVKYFILRAFVSVNFVKAWPASLFRYLHIVTAQA